MYSLENGLREICTMAEKPKKEVNMLLMQGKIMEFCGHLEGTKEIPTAVVEAMPHELRQAAIMFVMATLLKSLE